MYQNLERIKNSSQVIVCEGEADYLVLRMLGYDNIIGNIGGASACRDIIRDITKHIDKVIIAYDNDVAGKKAAEKLGISPRTLRYKINKLRDLGMAVPTAYARV